MLLRILPLRSFTLWASAALILSASLPSSTVRGNSVVVDWSKAATNAIRQLSIKQPTVVSRAFAIVHTCMFDAWAAYDSAAVGTRYGAALRRPSGQHNLKNKEKAISFAAYRALVDLFPTQASIADQLMANLGYDPNDHSVNVNHPSGIGNVAAAAVLAFRHHDGSNQLGDLNGGAPYSDYTGYTPVNTWDQVNDPPRWQPLRVPTGLPAPNDFAIQVFVTPHWTHVIPFSLTSSSQFRPPPPEPYGTARFVQQSVDILDLMAGLDDRKKMIVEYWGDNPPTALPPGHWMEFAQFVSNRDGYGIDDDARMFFLVANATFDEGIAVWEAKAFYDYVRPVTTIRYLFAGLPVLTWAGPFQGTQVIDGANFHPFQRPTVNTPPFAEYPSGHSAFSAGSAEVLKRYTGSDFFGATAVRTTGSSTVERFVGAPGTFLVPAADVVFYFETFSDAAADAGISRRLGGIHFEDGDLASRAIGRQVGAQVWAKAVTYMDTVAPTLTASAKKDKESKKQNNDDEVTRVSGEVTDLGLGVDRQSGFYTAVDTQGVLRAAGTFTIATDGSYSFTFALPGTEQAKGSDKGKENNERRHTVTVKAQDRAGHQGSTTLTLIGPGS